MDILSLKLHVDKAGSVWYSNCSGPPVNTKKSLAGFLLSPLCSVMPKYRVVGTRDNAQLILALYARQLQTGKGITEVCSPQACSTSAARQDPVSVLFAMREYNLAASLGGWHTFGREDYPAYAISSYTDKLNKVDEYSVKLMQSHLVWPALSYIPHLNEYACAALVGLVLDPRWYINPVNPVRGSKLRSYLGLDLKTFAGVLGEGPKQRYHERCALVWAAVNGAIDIKKQIHPNYFLYRVCKNHSEKHGELVGKLRMAQTFVEYLRLTWLAALGLGRHQNEALFVPEHFFNDELEIASWRVHMKKKIDELSR